jgi:signal transduction histidine kinase
VSRSIIERHQGRLWAEPNDGGPGATFSFSIPRYVQDQPDGSAATTATGEGNVVIDPKGS